nr:7TM GPCR domain containing protein [Haemonchus contortus]
MSLLFCFVLRLNSELGLSREYRYVILYSIAAGRAMLTAHMLGNAFITFNRYSSICLMHKYNKIWTQRNVFIIIAIQYGVSIAAVAYIAKSNVLYTQSEDGTYKFRGLDPNVAMITGSIALIIGIVCLVTSLGMNVKLFVKWRILLKNRDSSTGRHAEKVQQQNQALQQQMQQLLTVLVEQKVGPEQSPAKQQSPDAYGDLMTMPYFNYDEDDDSTFDAWYKRYGPVIDDRGSSLPDDRKRNLIIDKLDKATYKTYSEHVLPLKPRDIDLPTTVETLAKLFGPKKTLIRRRFEFLQSSCPPMSGTHIPYRDFGNTIKKKFEEACMKDVDSESLKCLVFVSGLTDASHSEMRLRLLNKMNRLKESDPLPVLDDFISECETFVTLRSDNQTMETKEINAAHQRRPMKKQRYPKRGGGVVDDRSTVVG